MAQVLTAPLTVALSADPTDVGADDSFKLRIKYEVRTALTA